MRIAAARKIAIISTWQSNSLGEALRCHLNNRAKHASDLEIRLIFFGRAHTDSDIVSDVPSLGVLFTGDLFDNLFAFIADRFDPSVTDLAEQQECVLRQLRSEGAGGH